MTQLPSGEQSGYSSELPFDSGCPSGELVIAVKDEIIGWFTIDDNSNLWDENLPRFILEYRDENIPAERLRLMHNRGWVPVTPGELLDVLQSAAVSRRE